MQIGRVVTDGPRGCNLEGETGSALVECRGTERYEYSSVQPSSSGWMGVPWMSHSAADRPGGIWRASIATSTRVQRTSDPPGHYYASCSGAAATPTAPLPLASSPAVNHGVHAQLQYGDSPTRTSTLTGLAVWTGTSAAGTWPGERSKL